MSHFTDILEDTVDRLNRLERIVLLLLDGSHINLEADVDVIDLRIENRSDHPK